MWITASNDTTSTRCTDKQIALISRLARERRQPMPLQLMTRREASDIITALMAVPAAPSSDGVTMAGMYRDATGRIFKVQKSKESGNLYAKELTPIGGQRLTDAETVVSFEFVYAAGAIRSLTDADRLTIDEAKAFGIRYGVCCVCGKTLSDAKSVAAGIGPVCAGRV